MDGTSIGYAIYMYDCFKAEFVIEFILLNWWDENVKLFQILMLQF
jgi:hypothetical protein